MPSIDKILIFCHFDQEILWQPLETPSKDIDSVWGVREGKWEFNSFLYNFPYIQGLIHCERIEPRIAHGLSCGERAFMRVITKLTFAVQ